MTDIVADPDRYGWLYSPKMVTGTPGRRSSKGLAEIERFSHSIYTLHKYEAQKYLNIPVVPHKAVAEVSRIGNV